MTNYIKRGIIMKKRLASLILISAMTLMAGCGSAKNEATTEAVTESTAVTTEAATTSDAHKSDKVISTTKPSKDRSGNDIGVPEVINSIVSMSPSTTRFLIDLGLSDKIIAIDTNSASYLDKLPSDVKQFDMMTPDNETLVSLDPDIIFTSGMSSKGGEDAYQSARDAGICVADIPSSASFADIADDLIFIGDCVDATDKAAQIVDDMNKQIEKVKEAAKNIDTTKTILFEITLPTADFPSIYSVGSGTYLDEMITTIGAKNATGDQKGWISISEEEAIALNPDVIITDVNDVDDAVGTIKAASGWENVNAIINGEVYYVDADASNQPNNHVVDAMIQMAKQVYPDVFADFEDPFSTASSGDAASSNDAANSGDAEE